MMDKGIVLQVHIVVCMIVGITQSSPVPDNVVWTPPTATFWLGQANPHITCQFLGTPYLVEWLKDSETILTWLINPQPQGTTLYGQGIDATRFGITDDHHTLLFNDLTESDSGTYTCEVSNYKGFIISNQTEVRVHDPANIGYTKPNITTWKGSSEYLPCDFTGTARKVLWDKIDNTRQPPGIETVLRYADDVYEVTGSNSRFSWNKNYELHVRDIEVLDGANYTCKVWKNDGTQLQNSTLMTVYALPEEPYVQIAQCSRCMALQDDHKCTCTHNVTDDTDSFTLDCKVTGAKPKVTDITWSEGVSGRVINDTKVVHTKLPDGSFGTQATMSANLSAIADATSFTCSATGRDVDGTWDFEQTISVRVLPPVLPPFHLPSGAIAALCIFFLLAIICCLLIFFSLYKYRRSVLRRNLPPTVISCCKCLDFKPEAQNWGALEEIQAFTTEIPSKEQDPLITILREKRTNIDNYIPGSMSQIVFPEKTIFKIGLYGIRSAGKSSFVNSLSFAVKGKYRDIADVTKPYGGIPAMYRQSVPLTRHVHAIDTKGMQDFDESCIKRILDEIRGKRGQDPTKKVSDGKEIHCPVFILKSSDAGGPDAAMPFLKQLSDGVHKKFGRHVLVVITHKDEMAKESENTDQQQNISGDQNDTQYQGPQHRVIESRGNHGSEVQDCNARISNEQGTQEEAKRENGTASDTASGEDKNSAKKEKPKKRISIFKHTQGLTIGEYFSKKKGGEYVNDDDEAEQIISDRRENEGQRGNEYEVVVSVDVRKEGNKESSPSGEGGSKQHTTEKIVNQQPNAGQNSNVQGNVLPDGKVESKKKLNDGCRSQNPTQAHNSVNQCPNAEKGSAVKEHDKLENEKRPREEVGSSTNTNMTPGGGNTLSRWRKNILNNTEIPDKNIWAFENYTDDKHDEDRERSIEFLDFLSVCLDTAERNAQFREEYKREKKSKTSYRLSHPKKWF